MKKRNWIFYLLALMLVVFVVACGGAEEEAPADPTAAPEVVDEPTDEPEVVEEPTDEPAVDEPDEEMTDFETNIVVWADNLLSPVVNEIKVDFEQEYGIGLIVEDVTDRYDQFPVAAAAGEGPDIILLAHDRIGGYYDSGLLATIDLAGREDEFAPAAIDAFTYNGDLVGLPYATENLAFFYNADLVDAPPATWEEAMEIGAGLVDSGDATYALALTGTTYDSFPIHTAFGGYVFGNDGSGYDPNDVGIDSAGMIAAGDFIQENVEAGLISDSTDWDTAHLQFETGEIPFLMAGPWALERLRESGVNYAVADFPVGTQQGESFLGVQGWSVNALSENVLLAQTILTEYFATEDVMRQFTELTNRPSAYNATPNPDPELVAFGDVAVGGLPMPAIPEMGSIWGSWGDAFSLIISGEQTASDALGNAGAQIRDLIGGSMEGAIVAVGSFQAAAGCDGDWDPACNATRLTDNGDGTYSGVFNLPAGDYEGKVAFDGGWTENYGLDGAPDGENIPFTVDADGPVTITFDGDSKITTFEAGGDGAMMEDDGDMMMGGDCNGVDATGEEVVIYQQAGREGPLAAILGDGFVFATEDVVNYINENGGVCGAEMVVEFCETGYNPENEIACYNETRTADPAPIVLMSYGSGATIALKDRVVEDEIVHVVSGLNAEALYNPADGYTVAAFPIYTDQFGGFLQYVADNWDEIKPEGAGDEIIVGVVGWANAFGAGANTPETEAFAEELGITLLDLEQQEISPEADVSGVLQNLILGGANVIYAQNLSFGTTQVIGTLRALGAWDSVVVGGVNWTFNTDVLAFLGENQAAADGYYGVFPNLWYNDEGNMTVDLAAQFSEEGGRDPIAGGVTYLTSISAFLVLEQMLEDAIGRNGFENLSGATLMDSIKETGTYSDGVLNIDVTDGRRAPNMAQIRQFQFNGESIDFTVVEDWFELPDLRPGQ